MTLAADIAGDHTIFDSVETVTLTPLPTGSAVATVKSLREPLTKADLEYFAGLGIDATAIVFNLWNATLGGLSPKSPDTITDGDAVVWTIHEATQETLGTRWRCRCLKQRA